MSQFPGHILDLYFPPICNFKKLASEKIDRNKKIYDLNQAVPDYLPPDNIRNSLLKNLNSDDYPFYTPGEGLPEFRAAISKELESIYEGQVESRNICVVAGANNAFYSVLSTIASPGDEIILLTPHYFNHYMAARILNITPVEVVLDAGRGLPLSIDKIIEKVTSRTRAVVLVNPGNPTGKCYPQNEVNALYEMCRKKEIFLISDEVYNYFHNDYPRPASVINASGFPDFAVSIHSYSKTFSLTGFRVGFIVASEKFLHHFMKVHDTNVICAPRFGQIAAMEGLRASREWVEEKVKIMSSRVRAFEEFFRKKESKFSIVSSGVFFIYLNFEMPAAAEEVCLKLIEKENLIMLPGTFSGRGQEKSIRLALGKLSLEDIPEVVRKIQDF